MANLANSKYGLVNLKSREEIGTSNRSYSYCTLVMIILATGDWYQELSLTKNLEDSH